MLRNVDIKAWTNFIKRFTNSQIVFTHPVRKRRPTFAQVVSEDAAALHQL